MALVGVLSTQLLHEQLVRQAPARMDANGSHNHIDRVAQTVTQ
jgi:hypothetical protein